eukprot:11773665-Ditylum_brightwellii.AAC.1
MRSASDATCADWQTLCTSQRGSNIMDGGRQCSCTLRMNAMCCICALPMSARDVPSASMPHRTILRELTKLGVDVFDVISQWVVYCGGEEGGISIFCECAGKCCTQVELGIALGGGECHRGGEFFVCIRAALCVAAAFCCFWRSRVTC